MPQPVRRSRTQISSPLRSTAPAACPLPSPPRKIVRVEYIPGNDSIIVKDVAAGMEYKTGVEEKTSRITVLLDSGVPLPGPPSFAALAAVLRADGPGPEAINGRLAMVAFLAAAGAEAATGVPLAAQLASGAGLAAAAALAAAVIAASLAPAYVGAKRIGEVFPSTNDAYPDSQLPFYFSPLAEVINGRAAMASLSFWGGGLTTGASTCSLLVSPWPRPSGPGLLVVGRARAHPLLPHPTPRVRPSRRLAWPAWSSRSSSAARRCSESSAALSPSIPR